MLLQKYHSIRHIDKALWDELAGDNPLASHGWLETVELTHVGSQQPLYITAEKPAGRMLGAAVCYIVDKGPTLGDFDHIALGRLKSCAHKLGLSFMPLVVCGPLYAYGKHIHLADSTDEAQRLVVTNAIVGEIESIALSLGLSIVFPNITRPENQLLKQLARSRFLRVPDLPQSVLDIEWRDFNGYLKFLRKQRGKNIRNNVKKEMNRVQRRGVEIRIIDDPALEADRLHELLNLNYIRHNDVPFMFNRFFFKTLKTTMGESAVIHGAFRDGVLNGASIQLKGRTEGHVAFIGVDHEAAGNDNSYFNLFFYVPIAEAISAGLECLYFDRLMYAMKRKRGCHFLNTHFCFKPKNRWLGLLAALWFRGLGWWNRRVGPGL